MERVVKLSSRGCLGLPHDVVVLLHQCSVEYDPDSAEILVNDPITMRRKANGLCDLTTRDITAL